VIRLELQPETEAQLVTEAQARGLTLDRYIEKIVESRPAEQSVSQQKSHSVSEAISGVKVPYNSRNPSSGIANYEILDTSIALEFVGGKYRYIYDAAKPGPIHLHAMIRLAEQGRGLATYVSQHVGDNYAAKIKIE
jgi:hypothetical protein